MPSETIQTNLIRRLRASEGHLRGIIMMVETEANSQDILHQILAVRAALHEVNRLLIRHQLHDCLSNQLVDPDPAVREPAIANVIALYGLAGAAAPLSHREETL